MKLFLNLFTIFTFIVLTSIQCRKNKPTNPVDQLPPETQTGANTFACLIDGKVFKPKGDPFGGPVIKAQYQFVNGKQGFGISARRSEGEKSQSIGIGGDSIVITNRIYNLDSKNIDGKLYGMYLFSQIGTLGNSYYTNEIQKGQITIKYFNTTNQIVSGTFWFDAIDNTTGKIVQIREGRFDLTYVR